MVRCSKISDRVFPSCFTGPCRLVIGGRRNVRQGLMVAVFAFDVLLAVFGSSCGTVIGVVFVVGGTCCMPICAVPLGGLDDAVTVGWRVAASKSTYISTHFSSGGLKLCLLFARMLTCCFGLHLFFVALQATMELNGF